MAPLSEGARPSFWITTTPVDVVLSWFGRFFLLRRWAPLRAWNNLRGKRRDFIGSGAKTRRGKPHAACMPRRFEETLWAADAPHLPAGGTGGNWGWKTPLPAWRERTAGKRASAPGVPRPQPALVHATSPQHRQHPTCAGAPAACCLTRPALAPPPYLSPVMATHVVFLTTGLSTGQDIRLAVPLNSSWWHCGLSPASFLTHLSLRRFAVVDSTCNTSTTVLHPLSASRAWANMWQVDGR